jgi:carbon-monoxide dehydrogenase large subunit
MDQLGPVPTGGRKEHEWRRAIEVDPGLVPLLRMEVQPLMAVDKVRYVGEPVAVVLAESRYAAEDALDHIFVDYEPLPVAADVNAASQPDAPRVHDQFEDNVSARIHIRVGNADAAFASADRVVRRRYRMQRVTGVPIENRAVLAQPRDDGTLMVWASSQGVHVSREAIAHHLKLPEERVRVVAQDVGGGFGIKSGAFTELVLAAWLAHEHGRPVKWTEDRSEHLRAAHHARDQVHDVELALSRDGTIVGLRDRFTVDSGAYNPHGLGQAYNSATHLVGPYRVPAVDVECAVIFTNKVNFAPYRGAGRPESVYTIERLVDDAARELGLDPAELRRRNLISAAEMPYDTGLKGRDGIPTEYDSGDYPRCFEEALRLIGYDAVRREQPELWGRGVYRGVGLAAYVESTGSGPFEGASVGLDESGHVWVYTGACSQGQGHETTFAQVCAEQLRVPVDVVTVVAGDTGGIARGQGARSSRLAVVAGSAVAQASEAVGDRLRELASELLEASPADLELEAGAVRVRGVPQRAVSFAQLVAHAARVPEPSDGPHADGQAGRPAPLGAQGELGFDGAGRPTALPPKEGTAADEERPLPPDRTPLGIRETRYYSPPTFTYTNAVHAALVEVDADTGAVQVLNYVVVHDAGRVINPTVANGQIMGGVAAGVGNALMEECAYDANGQLLSGSLMDYLVPTTCEVPPMALEHFESPSPRNPIGVKGLGEGGAIGPPAAISNAVADALRPFAVEVDTLPLTPERVLGLIEASRGRVPG